LVHKIGAGQFWLNAKIDDFAAGEMTCYDFRQDYTHIAKIEDSTLRLADGDPMRLTVEDY